VLISPHTLLLCISTAVSLQTVHHGEGPIVCKGDTELQEAVGTMLAHNVHRLFVVDDARKPVSVLTYGDIIASLTS
jgi:CBS domain-containing protein